MEIFKHQSNLGCVELCFLIVQVSYASEVVEELSSSNEIQIKDQVLLILRYSVHFDLNEDGPYQKRMINCSQYIDFGDYMINLLELNNLAFFQNFESVKLSVLFIECKSDSTKGT